MTKEDKAKEYGKLNAKYIGGNSNLLEGVFLDGYNTAESDQTQLIKAALRFAKSNHNFCFTEDMMFQLFKESEGLPMLVKEDEANDEMICKFAEWVYTKKVFESGGVRYTAKEMPELLSQFKQSLKQ